MEKKYEEHKKIYDITDRAALILSEFSKLSKLIDPEFNIPNSLQATIGKIYRYEGKTQSEIAKIYKADKQNTIRYISELEHRGLIYKVELDNKRKGIYLTEKGKKTNEHFMEARGKFLERALFSIPEENLQITKETLQQLITIIVEYIAELEE
jgi:DNA-binding MarR family transcriptional regulator